MNDSNMVYRASTLFNSSLLSCFILYPRILFRWAIFLLVVDSIPFVAFVLLASNFSINVPDYYVRSMTSVE